MVAQVFLLVNWEVSLVLWELCDTVPLIRTRCTSNLEDLKKLIALISSGEQRFFRYDFSKDTANRPDVN